MGKGTTRATEGKKDEERIDRATSPNQLVSTQISSTQKNRLPQNPNRFGSAEIEIKGGKHTAEGGKEAGHEKSRRESPASRNKGREIEFSPVAPNPLHREEKPTRVEAGAIELPCPLLQKSGEEEHQSSFTPFPCQKIVSVKESEEEGEIFLVEFFCPDCLTVHIFCDCSNCSKKERLFIFPLSLTSIIAITFPFSPTPIGKTLAKRPPRSADPQTNRGARASAWIDECSSGTLGSSIRYHLAGAYCQICNFAQERSERVFRPISHPLRILPTLPHGQSQTVCTFLKTKHLSLFNQQTLYFLLKQVGLCKQS
jgi:hypothetical protein